MLHKILKRKPSSDMLPAFMITCAATVLLTVGCAGEIGPETREEAFADDADFEGADALEQAIKNGSFEGSRKGLVEVLIPGTNGGSCSGSLISPQWAITAAHCIQEKVTGHSGTVSGTLIYADPATGDRLLTASPETLNYRIIPTFDCVGRPANSCLEYKDDIVLIGRRSGAWKSTDASDYLTLHGGSSGGAYNSVTGMRLWGFGRSSASGSFGTLRSAAVKFVDRAHHEYSTVAESPTQGACIGDSGGPLIATSLMTSPQIPVLFGVISGGDGTGACSISRQYGARVASRIGWIKSIVPNCRDLRQVTQCF